MAYNESLASRLRECFARTKDVVEKKMFGSVVFLIHGNLLVGVWKDSLIVRVGPDNYEDALLEEHVCEFDVTGRPMKGWIMVEPEGVETDESLRTWIDRATEYVRSLPKK